MAFSISSAYLAAGAVPQTEKKMRRPLLSELQTGNFTGNFAILAQYRCGTLQFVGQIQSVATKFPTRRNRGYR